MTCLGEEASLASAAECTRCRTRRPVVAQVSPSRRRWDDRATRKAQEVPADLGRACAFSKRCFLPGHVSRLTGRASHSCLTSHSKYTISYAGLSSALDRARYVPATRDDDGPG